MPRAGLTPATVVREAARLADEVGYEQYAVQAACFVAAGLLLALAGHPA